MTVSVTTIQEKVERASQAEIISFLSAVVGWETNLNDPTHVRRKVDAQDHLNKVLFNGGQERARKFLHGIAEQAAARNGF